MDHTQGAGVLPTGNDGSSRNSSGGAVYGPLSLLLS